MYHKPAAVVRSPVIYKHLPRKVQYRQVVKHIVKPIERKIVLKDKQQPHICTHSAPKYFVGPQADAITDATNNVQYQQYIQRPTNLFSQPETMFRADTSEGGEVVDENQYVPPLDIARVYYRQSFPAIYPVMKNY